MRQCFTVSLDKNNIQDEWELVVAEMRQSFTCSLDKWDSVLHAVWTNETVFHMQSGQNNESLFHVQSGQMRQCFTCSLDKQDSVSHAVWTNETVFHMQSGQMRQCFTCSLDKWDSVSHAVWTNETCTLDKINRQDEWELVVGGGWNETVFCVRSRQGQQDDKWNLQRSHTISCTYVWSAV